MKLELSKVLGKMFPKNKQKRGANRRVTQNKTPNVGRIIHPPQLKTNVQLTHTYRFMCNNNGTYNITPDTLLLAAGCVGSVTNTTVVGIFASCRINYLEMWAPPASQGQLSTISCEWLGLTPNEPNIEVSDSSVSVAYPAYLRAKPPMRSLGCFWQTTNGNDICQLTVPSGTLIDVSLSLVMFDQDLARPSSAVATAVVGEIYYLALDGPSSNHLTPIAMATTH
jgi:hypothetical protein